jgi:hypothetical protein
MSACSHDAVADRPLVHIQSDVIHSLHGGASLVFLNQLGLRKNICFWATEVSKFKHRDQALAGYTGGGLLGRPLVQCIKGFAAHSA